MTIGRTHPQIPLFSTHGGPVCCHGCSTCARGRLGPYTGFWACTVWKVQFPDDLSFRVASSGLKRLADLLDDSTIKGVEAQGFIDDITLIVTGKSTRGNNQKPANVHNSTCEDWRIKHGSEFSISKYQLIHISRKRDLNYTAGVRLTRGHVVRGIVTAINLGLTLQSKLSWKDHISKIKSKAIKSLGAMSSIAGSTWGGGFLAMRRIFKSVIIPQITCGASIWHTPTSERGGTAENSLNPCD